MSMETKGTEFWEEERRKCVESPAYFYKTYFRPGATIVGFSGEEFDAIVKGEARIMFVPTRGGHRSLTMEYIQHKMDRFVEHDRVLREAARTPASRGPEKKPRRGLGFIEGLGYKKKGAAR